MKNNNLLTFFILIISLLLLGCPQETTNIDYTISINESDQIYLSIGGTYQLSATVKPSGSSTYSSTNSSVVSATSTGLITGVSIGTTTITAKCSADSSVKDSITVNVIKDEFNYSSSSPVYNVNFYDRDTVVVSVKNAVGKKLYLVKANNSSSLVTGNNTGTGAYSANTLDSSSSLLKSSTIANNNVSYYREDFAKATSFNNNPPEISVSNNRSLLGVEKNSSISYGDSTLIVGTTTKTFWVQNSSDVWVSETATLRAKGQYCYVWVLDSNYDDSTNSPNTISSSQATELQVKFDGTLGNSYNDGIFKNVTNIYGYEYGGGVSGDGGKDSDQHISILVYDIDGDYSVGQAGGVYGFFWGKDYYDQASLDTYGYKTNLSEMFYIDSHFTDIDIEGIISTLAHEYQHMINFSKKALEHNLSTSSWYNEMMSMVAEDLVLANIGLDQVLYGAQNRFPEFLYHYDESGVTDWLSGYDVLKSYATAFAFGAYLTRNYGGADLFKAIMDNSYTDEASVTVALASLGYTDTFTDAFKKYGEALVFTDKPTDSNVKTFKKSDTSSIGAISYTASSIDISNLNQYNLDNSSVGNLGIWTYLPSVKNSLRPYGNSVHTGTSWSSLTSNFKVTLNKPSNENVLYYLMVK